MTPTWFTPERVEVLEARARAWIGTPFAPNSSARGIGACCHKLARELYVEAGFLMPEVPDAPIAHARWAGEGQSLIVEWLDRSCLFQDATGEEPQPGDAVGFRINRIVHHLGIVLPGGLFVHALDGLGVSVASLADATWKHRTDRIWRPRP